jgi:preprotein translocase subunit SecG
VFTLIFVVLGAASAVALIFLVLMHSGRGGGISDLMGGSMGSMAQGSTVVERNLDRITIAVALVFAFSTLTLDLRLQ